MRLVAAGVIIWLLVAVGCLLFAVNQPWLGLEFRKVVLAAGIEVAAVAPKGPAHGRLLPGDVLVQLRAGENSIDLMAEDIRATGPLGRYDEFNAFLTRQERIATALRNGEIVIRLSDGREIGMRIPLQRPLRSLPAELLIECTVLPATALLIVLLVVRRRPRDSAAWHLFVMSIGYIAIVALSALYTRHELALPATPFHALISANNVLGMVLFGGGAVAVLWHHPNSLTQRPAAPWIYGLASCGGLIHLLELFETLAAGLWSWTFVSLAAQIAVAGVQWRRAASRPAYRAMLKWFCVPWFCFIVAYFCLFYIPIAAGLGPQAPQIMGELLFLLIFVGLALGLTRYRLYYLNPGHLLLWFLQGLLVVGLLLAGLRLMDLSYFAAACLALLITGLLHGALRRAVWSLQALQRVDFRRVLNLVMGALTQYRTSMSDGNEWQKTLDDLFAPKFTRKSALAAIQPVAILDEGEQMRVAIPGASGTVDLQLPYRGRGLFMPEDALAVEEIYRVFDAISRYWSAYADGEMLERARLSRRLDEGLGRSIAALVAAAPSPTGRRHAEHAAEELRTVCQAMIEPRRALSEYLEEMQAETAARCATAGIALEWRASGITSDVDGRTALALRGVIREAVTNIIRHSGARRAIIACSRAGDHALMMVVEDDGRCDMSLMASGRGVGNMQRRASILGGSLELDQCADGGLRLQLVLPIMAEPVSRWSANASRASLESMGYSERKETKMPG